MEAFKQTEFFGQRPWRPGKLGVDSPDPQADSRGIHALQYFEKQVNHSVSYGDFNTTIIYKTMNIFQTIIISMYGFAISQYKTYRCLRMRRQLVVQMAEEYYNSEEYGKALT